MISTEFFIEEFNFTSKGAHALFFKTFIENNLDSAHTITQFPQRMCNSASFTFNGAQNNVINAAFTY